MLLESHLALDFLGLVWFCHAATLTKECDIRLVILSSYILKFYQWHPNENLNKWFCISKTITV